MAARYPHLDSEDEDVGHKSSSGSETDPEPEQEKDRSAQPVSELAQELSALGIQGNSSDAPEEDQVAASWAVHRNSHPEMDKYKALWAEEQLELKQKLSVEDSPEVLAWRGGIHKFINLKLVGGVDISFIKGDAVNACAILVILEYPSLKLLHQEIAMVELTLPYIPGFLAFREAPFLKDRLDLVRKTKPNLIPQVILVDGNGILHTRGFGLASQLGVMSDIPTIGVAKKLFAVDGLYKNSQHLADIKSLKRAGDSFPLIGLSGKTWGVALKGASKVVNPVYVSAGHKISLSTAEELVFSCSRSRIPEPVRQADLRSREYIRKLQGKQCSKSGERKYYTRGSTGSKEEGRESCSSKYKHN